MNLQESGEMYLESIYVLCNEKKNVRSIDIVEYMNFSKPSVSRAVGLLKNGGYIEVDSEGLLILTKYGKDIAEKIYERHTMLTELFVRLGVDKETASDDACKIEHHLSDQTFTAIKSYIEKLK